MIDSEFSRRSFLKITLGTMGSVLVPKNWLPPEIRQTIATNGRLWIHVGLAEGFEEVSGAGYSRGRVELHPVDNGWMTEDTIIFPTAQSSWGEVSHLIIFGATQLQKQPDPLVQIPLTERRTINSGDTASLPPMSVKVELI